MELPINREIYNSLNNIKNNRIMRNVYTFCDKQKRDNYNQLLSYHTHKISRKFIFETGKVFSNLHGCGLFTYCALLSNSCSHFKKKHKTVYAWVKGNLKYYSKILNLRSKKEIFGQLDKLKDAKLIDYRVKESDILVFLLEGNVNVEQKYTRKQIMAQYAAIKSHSGYFFVNDINLMELRESAEFYSEADAMVDLWLNTIYNDYNLPISDSPVVFLDSNRNNYSDDINVTTDILSKRWGCSFGRVNKLLKKMVDADFVDIYILPNLGTVIFNKSYFTYFCVSKKYNNNTLVVFKYFYKNSYLYKYISYLYKNKLNYSRKGFLLKMVRFIKRIGFSPYSAKKLKINKRHILFRIKDLLSLFDFCKNHRNSFVLKVFEMFFEKV